MKRFDFRLARVLKVKRQQEWLAELKQKQARAVLDAALARVAALRDLLTRTADLLAGQLGQAVEADSWIAGYEHSRQIERSLDLAEIHVQEATVKWQEALARQTQKRQEVEALQHLRSRQWQAYQRDAALEQQEQLDELSMRRWMANQAEDADST